MEVQEDLLKDIISCIQRTASPSQKAKVKAWLDESDDHRLQFDELAASVHRLDYINTIKSVDDQSALIKVKKQITKQPAKTIWLKIASVAAVVVLIVTISFITDLFTESDYTEPDYSALNVEPGEFKATLTLSNGEEVFLGKSGNIILKDVDATIENKALDGITYQSNIKDTSKDSLVFNTLRVRRGEEFKLTLADGTIVWLNSDSELYFPVSFNSDERRVYIKGEGYFDVAHNPSKPFIVQSGEVSTTALGTAFNVENYNDSERMAVTLVEGKVRVNAKKKETVLIPGNQVILDKETLSMQKHNVKTFYYTSWKDGVFDFDGMQLDDLTVRLGRWYDVDFVFENEKARNIKFTGAFKRDKPLGFTLSFIESTSDVQFKIKDEKIIIGSK